MYVLINTFWSNPARGQEGTIVSTHGSFKDAALAEARMAAGQRPGTAIPTKIARLIATDAQIGAYITTDECKDIHFTYYIEHGDVVTLPCDCHDCVSEAIAKENADELAELQAAFGDLVHAA